MAESHSPVRYTFSALICSYKLFRASVSVLVENAKIELPTHTTFLNTDVRDPVCESEGQMFRPRLSIPEPGAKPVDLPIEEEAQLYHITKQVAWLSFFNGF